jgi:WD40 repeat protein
MNMSSDEVHSLAFSPDSRLLAAGTGYLGEVSLWKIPEGEKLTTLQPSIPELSGLAFYPNGCYLATAYSDGTLRIWGVP